MFVAEQKYSRGHGRTHRAEVCFVLLLFCLMALQPGMDDSGMSLTQVSFADIVHSPRPGRCDSRAISPQSSRRLRTTG